MKANELCEVGLPIMYVYYSCLLGLSLGKESLKRQGHLHVTVRTCIILDLHVTGSWLNVAPFNLRQE